MYEFTGSKAYQLLTHNTFLFNGNGLKRFFSSEAILICAFNFGKLPGPDSERPYLHWRAEYPSLDILFWLVQEIEYHTKLIYWLYGYGLRGHLCCAVSPQWHPPSSSPNPHSFREIVETFCHYLSSVPEYSLAEDHSLGRKSRWYVPRFSFRDAEAGRHFHIPQYRQGQKDLTKMGLTQNTRAPKSKAVILLSCLNFAKFHFNISA